MIGAASHPRAQRFSTTRSRTSRHRSPRLSSDGVSRMGASTVAASAARRAGSSGPGSPDPENVMSGGESARTTLPIATVVSRIPRARCVTAHSAASGDAVEDTSAAVRENASRSAEAGARLPIFRVAGRVRRSSTRSSTSTLRTLPKRSLLRPRGMPPAQSNSCSEGVASPLPIGSPGPGLCKRVTNKISGRGLFGPDNVHDG